MADLPEFTNTTPPPPDSAPVGGKLRNSKPPAATGRWQGPKVLLVWALRWAGLGVGVSAAWLVGMVMGQFFPGQATEPPLQELVVRRTQRVSQKLGRLPQWWVGDELRPATPAAPVLSEPAPEVAAPRPVNLTPEQREQITTELEAIQGDLQRLRDRASALEVQLGLPTLSEPLATRLATVSSRLSPETDVPVNPVAPLSPTAEDATVSPAPAIPIHPLLQVDAYRVTLPSDLLFTGGEAILQPTATQLLDSILADVGRYPGATILVGSYSDRGSDSEAVVALSFQQAIAVQRYLSERLGEDQYHWLTVGYGNSGLGNPSTTPLTRRIAIAIVPAR
jgi:outer membrane protein OmpA-like peptidoglycan-associated protein